MFGFFVLVEFKFKIVTVLLNKFLVDLLLDYFRVLDGDGFDGWWVYIDFLLLFVIVLWF